MDNPNNVELGTEAVGSGQPVTRRRAQRLVKESPSRATGADGTSSGNARKRVGKRGGAKSGARGNGKTKKEQLIALLSKPNGARLPILIERLGWQAHTVRAALSRLRKQGFAITKSKSAKGGETVYTMISSPVSNDVDTSTTAAR